MGSTRHILHCDMNCFYASVEMQRRPELRDRPLAVCGSQEERHGIVLTANYIAKPFGVKTGMAIWQARERCPDLVIVPPDMDEYIRISKMAREIYADYTDQIEPFGLDENWLDVTGSVGLFGDPMNVAKEISGRIKFELGITASIGVADNKITAKVGSDYKKPDAITRIEQDNYKEIVYPLPVEDLLYVGPATSKKLRGIGISTIGRLAECPVDLLVRKFGKMGAVLHTFANGMDSSPVQRSDHIPNIKSVGNSATTPRNLEDEADVKLMLYLLAESVCSRMRELVSRCTVVEIYVRDTELHSITRQRKLSAPSCSSQELADVGMELFRRHYHWERPIRSIGLRGAGLVEAQNCVQLSMYADDQKREKWERIDAAVDHLRQRYGYMSIRRALMDSDPLLGHIVHHVEDTMPDVCPICFGELTCENSVISGSDIVRCWKCTDCGSTGEAVYHARFSLHRNLKVRDGKAIYPWQLKERPEHDSQAGKY